MIWSVICRKCLQPLLVRDIIVSIEDDGKQFLMIIEGDCAACGMHNIYRFKGN
jgi:RNase P subunit RPR2